ncbi:uncharacterized protein PAC_12388 [Phialocephala subalpina]|uniref:Uncharacterized protein n=1 Tax=Phialocephala subalpina TaxID=576137 RepID=A0A1L7XBV1_9HELO|nr:uncharacterized protein PAC_12388 [Phialocephala subalpina]
MPYTPGRGSTPKKKFSPYKRTSTKPSWSAPTKRTRTRKAADISVPNDHPYKFNFRKHPGKTIKEVSRIDGSYIGLLKKDKAYEGRPALSDAFNWLRLYKEKIERLKEEAADAVDAEDDHPYTFTLPKHAGKAIKEVARIDGSYIGYVKKKRMYEKDPKLNEALNWLRRHKEKIERKQREAIAAFESTSPPTPIIPDYKLPNLASAPSYFFMNDLLSDDPTWIVGSDAMKYFGLSYTHLQYLEDHNGTLPETSESAARTSRGKRYWLYQVHDICKVHISEAAANVGFVNFEAKNQEREEDVWASMGLGACLL